MVPLAARGPQGRRALEKLRSGAPLDPEERHLILRLMEAPPQRSAGAERLALQRQGWSIAKIAQAEGATREAIKQSLRRERRRCEAQGDE